jgi:hypothetical protein
MIRPIVRFFRRKYLIAKLWFKKQTELNKRENTDNEKICSTICRKLINHQSSKFLIAPLSGKRYIKNTELGLFVILDEGKVSVTNHVYHYDVTLSFKEFSRLTRMYDNRTERNREAYEEEIKSQIVYSLSTILDKVNNGVTV